MRLVQMEACKLCSEYVSFFPTTQRAFSPYSLFLFLLAARHTSTDTGVILYHIFARVNWSEIRDARKLK